MTDFPGAVHNYCGHQTSGYSNMNSCQYECGASDVHFIKVTGAVEGSPEFNDRERFQGLFRTDATVEFLGEALAEIARKFNWTQMAIISRRVSAFSTVRRDTSINYERN